MEDIKEYLEDKISVLKFNLNMDLDNFYIDRGLENFPCIHEIMEELKDNIIDDHVNMKEIGLKHLVRNFGSKQHESTEFFYYRMIVRLAFCEFYLEKNNLKAVIANLNSFYFYMGVNESKNERKIQRLQMSDNGSRKGKNDSHRVQEIIKEMLISKVWITREDFYNKVYDKVCGLGIERSRKSIVRDFASAVKELENYQQYFEHKGKK